MSCNISPQLINNKWHTE